VTDKILNKLSRAASLAPSCYNNQPWRFVFVYEKEALAEFMEALSEGNSWAKDSSLIVAAFGDREDDCIVKERDYYLFDMGLAAENLMLQATEMGLVAHPIAGFNEKKAKKILGIPADKKLITLIVMGKHDVDTEEAQKEQQRPDRLPLKEFVFHNKVSS